MFFCVHQYRFVYMSCMQPILCMWITCVCMHVRRSCTPPCTWLCTLSKYFPSVVLYYIPYTTLKYVILVNIINNENLNHFSSLTTGKVSGLTICLETVKLMEYGIKEIDRELFEIKAEHFQVQFYLKLWWSEWISRLE